MLTDAEVLSDGANTSNSDIRKWAAGVVLAGLVAGTALLVGSGVAKVQEHDARLRYLEAAQARSDEAQRAQHETLLRMESSMAAGDQRIELKVDKLLERRRGKE